MLRRVGLFSLLMVLCGVMVMGPLAAMASGHGHKKADKKALLLVTFGTSIPEAQGVFKEVDASFKKAFPGLEIRWAYTSKIIRNKVAKKQGLTWLSPEEALAKLMAEDYTQIGVQSLHVIPGAEYHDLIAKVHGFKSMSSDFRALIGYPLCATTDDLAVVAEALVANLPKERKAEEAVVFMGHGTHHPAGVVYPAMAYLLEKASPLVFMGTVEGYPALDDIKKELSAAKVKKVHLLPFMTVAGDHAMNDMAGDEDDSWKSELKAMGVDSTPHMVSILKYPQIVELYIKKAKAVMGHFK